MKKMIIALLACAMLLLCVGCAGKPDPRESKFTVYEVEGEETATLDFSKVRDNEAYLGRKVTVIFYMEAIGNQPQEPTDYIGARVLGRYESVEHLPALSVIRFEYATFEEFIKGDAYQAALSDTKFVELYFEAAAN